MTFEREKALSRVNRKKALVSFTRRKVFKPVYKGRMKAFTGYQTLAHFRAKEREYLTIDFKVVQGEAVLGIAQKDTFTVLCDGACQKEMEIALDRGWARLRLLGESADLTYTVSRS